MSAVVNPEKFLVRDMGDADLDRVIAIEKILISTHGPKKFSRLSSLKIFLFGRRA